MKWIRIVTVATVALAVGICAGWGLARGGRLQRRGAERAGDGWNATTFKSTVTVATYNVHSFFDEYHNPYTADQGTGAKPLKERQALARAIRKVDADVIVLQEIEAGGVLKKFAADELGDLGYTAVDACTEDPRGITVAALSRLPVLRITSHRLAALQKELPEGPGNRLARDLLRLDIEMRPGFVVTVYGVHLKSKRSEVDANDANSAKRRLAEAAGIRAMIAEEMPPGSRFIFVGDCNDEIGSPAVQMIVRASDPPLVDGLAGIPAQERVTFHGGSYREAIDQVLLSPRLAEERVLDGAKIFSGEEFEKASDHYPVRVTLHVP